MLNECPDHQWVICLGFGKISGNEVYQRCQNCGLEEKVSIDPTPIIRMELNDQHD